MRNLIQSIAPFVLCRVPQNFIDRPIGDLFVSNSGPGVSKKANQEVKSQVTFYLSDRKRCNVKKLNVNSVTSADHDLMKI